MIKVNGKCQNTPRCPNGTIGVNGKCLKKPPCPNGITPVNGKCPNTQTLCPNGMINENGKCQNKPRCPNGTIGVNGKCLKKPPCPNGITPVNGICPNTQTHCPFGILVAGRCIKWSPPRCKNGKFAINGKCPTHRPIVRPPINGTNMSFPQIKCPPKTIKVGNSCRPINIEQRPKPLPVHIPIHKPGPIHIRK